MEMEKDRLLGMKYIRSEIIISSKTHICWLTISEEPWEAVQLFLISQRDKLDSIYTG